MPYMVLDPATATAAPNITFGAAESLSQHPAGKSLLGMRERLKLELGRRTDIPDSVWNEWINDAYADVFASLELPESKRSFNFYTVADQALYLLPPTVGSIRSVVGFNESDVMGASFEKIDSSTYRKLPILCGEPEAWFREQNILVLWSTPDDAYRITVDAIFKPAPLILDTDYPALEDRWHEIILKSAKVRAWEGVQNDVKASLTENTVARLVARQNDRDSKDSENEYPSMRPVFNRRDIMRIRPESSGIEPGE